jgi:hypothetical protein
MAKAAREGFAKGAVERSYPAFGEGAPLLNTFYFRFDRDGQSQIDNHLNSMWVLPGGESTDLSPNADLEPSKVSDGKIELTLMDRDPTSASDRYFTRSGMRYCQASSPDDSRSVTSVVSGRSGETCLSRSSKAAAGPLWPGSSCSTRVAGTMMSTRSRCSSSTMTERLWSH